METHYWIDAVSNEWICDTTIPRDMATLEKAGWILTETQYAHDGSVLAKFFRAPRNRLTPKKYDPNKPKKAVNQAQMDGL